MHFLGVQVVHSYSSTNMAGKNNHFILSERSDFHRIDNLLISDHAFSIHMLILLSIDEILLPRYVKWSTKFRG